MQEDEKARLPQHSHCPFGDLEETHGHPAIVIGCRPFP